MQLELAEKIRNLALETGDYCEEDIEIRADYRGRYRRDADPGIVGMSLAEILRLVISNANEFVDEDGDPIFDPSCFSQDSMGLSTIVY